MVFKGNIVHFKQAVSDCVGWQAPSIETSYSVLGLEVLRGAQCQCQNGDFRLDWKEEIATVFVLNHMCC